MSLEKSNVFGNGESMHGKRKDGKTIFGPSDCLTPEDFEGDTLKVIKVESQHGKRKQGAKFKSEPKNPSDMFKVPVQVGECPLCGGLTYSENDPSDDPTMAVRCCKCSYWENQFLKWEDINGVLQDPVEDEPFDVDNIEFGINRDVNDLRGVFENVDRLPEDCFKSPSNVFNNVDRLPEGKYITDGLGKFGVTPDFSNAGAEKCVSLLIEDGEVTDLSGFTGESSKIENPFDSVSSESTDSNEFKNTDGLRAIMGMEQKKNCVSSKQCDSGDVEEGNKVREELHNLLKNRSIKFLNSLGLSTDSFNVSIYPRIEGYSLVVTEEPNFFSIINANYEVSANECKVLDFDIRLDGDADAILDKCTSYVSDLFNICSNPKFNGSIPCGLIYSNCFEDV